ncbi:hypothetical protein EMIT0194P_110055 [Pseudomonas serbica]
MYNVFTCLSRFCLSVTTRIIETLTPLSKVHARYFLTFRTFSTGATNGLRSGIMPPIS